MIQGEFDFTKKPPPTKYNFGVSIIEEEEIYLTDEDKFITPVKILRLKT